MATFRPKDGNDTLDFDTTGTVSKAGGKIGSWTTSKDNKIIVMKTAGGQSALDAAWTFNEDNHLVLEGSGQKFDFNAQAGVRPIYRTVDSVLFVKPDRNQAFEFALRPSWRLTAAHDLEVTIGAKKSTIHGFIFDGTGRFRYHFFNKKDLNQESILGFRGEWLNGSEPGLVVFRYALETGGQTATFEFPKAVIVDTTINQLAYEYDKDGRTFKLQFVGRFNYQNLQLTYAIERSKTSDGNATTLTFGAVIASKNATGTLDFALTKTDGTVTKTTLSISGKYTARFQGGLLEIGYGFTQERAGQTVTNTLFFGGQLEVQGAAFNWVIKIQGKTTTLGLSAQQVVLGDARIEEALNVRLDGGKVAGIRALFGVSF